VAAKPGNSNAVKHGATSDDRIRPLARGHRRRVLRQLGLRAGDLDPLGRGYLDAYVRLVAKIDLLDAFYEEHGFLKPSGEPQESTRFYVSLANSARLALARLEGHLRERKVDPNEELRRYLAERGSS